MGGLSVEAEARDVTRPAESGIRLGSRCRLYDVAHRALRHPAMPTIWQASSARDFSKLLITGENPFDKKLSHASVARELGFWGEALIRRLLDAFGRTGVSAVIGGENGSTSRCGTTTRCR